MLTPAHQCALPCAEQSEAVVSAQVNLDGFALPVKKLKGTDPVETLDLSRKGLRLASAPVIASLIGVNASLTSVRVPPELQPMVPC